MYVATAHSRYEYSVVVVSLEYREDARFECSECVLKPKKMKATRSCAAPHG